MSYTHEVFSHLSILHKVGHKRTGQILMSHETSRIEHSVGTPLVLLNSMEKVKCGYTLVSLVFGKKEEETHFLDKIKFDIVRTLTNSST